MGHPTVVLVTARRSRGVHRGRDFVFSAIGFGGTGQSHRRGGRAPWRRGLSAGDHRHRGLHDGHVRTIPWCFPYVQALDLVRPGAVLINFHKSPG